MFIVETCQDLLQTKAALAAIFDHFEESERRVPVIAQVTIEIFGTMLNGTEIGAALTALEPFPIDVIGMNCGTGPKHMTDSFRYLCENSPLPVSVLPNAGLPEVKDGKQHYDETPESFAAQVEHFAKDFGVEHRRRLLRHDARAHQAASSSAMGSLAPKQRDAQLAPVGLVDLHPAALHAGHFVPDRRRARQRVGLEEDARPAGRGGLGRARLARARAGARGRAHPRRQRRFRRPRRRARHARARLAARDAASKIPLMLDSTEWEKMEAGLKHAGGKCILNSTNYEDGEPRFQKVLGLAQEYGAGVVVGTIDEDGMARTADGKLEIAHRAYEQATAEFGIPAHDIFFDPLALPISTGIEEDRRNAAETIEAMRRIKAELPGCHTILGVSNISFGLNAGRRASCSTRSSCTSAVEAGLNAAIVNASKILPLNRFDEHELRGRARPDLRPSGSFEGDVCTYDPLAEFTDALRGRDGEDG